MDEKPTSPPAPTSSAEFERCARQAQPGLARQLIAFLRENKKWWLTPIILVLLLVSLLIIFGGSAAAPFIYTLF